MPQSWRTPTAVLVCGAMILTLSLGLRHPLGLFLKPMVFDLRWDRETFSIALAVANLVWGMAQPFTGAVADRFGAGRVLAVGGALYAASMYCMAHSVTGLQFSLSGGLLYGLALSCTTFSIVFGVIGRIYPPDQRSMALGIAGAAGSFGQFVMVPVSQQLLSGIGWLNALIAFAALSLLILPLSAALKEDRPANYAKGNQSIREALTEAKGHKGFWMLTLGFFVCGFQVVFIGVHLPAYLLDRQMPPHVGVWALALIGFFNVFGTYFSGWLGGFMRKKKILTTIYLLRAMVIALFLALPISPLSVYFFAATIGLLWLSTVPLTNGVVAQIFGVRYLSMLSGIVFFGHQVGSFFGVYLGGLLFDKMGTYNVVWIISIGLSFVAAALNWPINDQVIERPQSLAQPV
ncbi:MAG TPA: MFS transporter [Burkholderiales bacterium]|nr:MFS transporter [Burkholderiales bacterium]